MENTIMPAKRETFNSKFGYLMSVLGLCIGLGNCQRFPYLVGAYGGGAFVLAYLICMLLILIPLTCTEVALGKHLQSGLVKGYEVVYHKKGIANLFGNYAALAYFAMNFFFVNSCAIALIFVWKSMSSAWKTTAPDMIYEQVITNTPIMFIFVAALVILLGVAVARGIVKGVELISKIMVPMILIGFAAIAIYNIFVYDNYAVGLNFYLNPDFSRLASFDIWQAAMGQCLFSVGFGCGAQYTYGSRMKRKADVTINVTTFCVMDMVAALLAGFAIIPAAVCSGIDPQSGFRLLFVVLPSVLAGMPGGSAVGVIMFLAVFFAAFTSAMGQLETPVTTLEDAFGWGRKKVTYILTAVTLAAAIPGVFYEPLLNFWSTLCGDYFFLISASIGAISWIWIYKVKNIRENMINPTSQIKLGRWFDYLTTFVSTPAMLFIMISSLVGLIFG